MTTQQRRAERVKGYHLHLTDIKSVISNIVLVMPDIGSYINQNCAKSFILKHWSIANSYKECNLDKAHGKKYCSKAGLNSCPRKLVVEIVSTDIVGTLKCFYSKCSQNPCRKNIPRRLVVEDFPQAQQDHPIPQGFSLLFKALCKSGYTW